jgi:sedoheptulokinase
MTLGMLKGILAELFEMYEEMCRMTGTRAKRLVASGNGIRKNSLMQELAEELFQMKMEIPVCREEAAYGAALHSLVSAGLAASLEEVQKKIHYMDRA